MTAQMNAETAPQQPASRSSALLAGLDAALPQGPVTVGGLMDVLGDTGLGMMLIIFALPSFIPTPGLPVGVITGTVLMLIAMQVMTGRHVLWLPERLRRASLPRAFIIQGAALLARPMRIAEGWMSERSVHLAGRTARQMLALPILLLAVSILLPIPLGNQLPSLALIAFGFGLMERDGLAIIAALVLSAVALAWVTFVVLFGAQAAAAATHYIGSLGWF